MTPADPNEKRAFFDHHAKRWDETTYTREQLARIGPLVANFGLEKGWRVLDMGCGTGVLAPHLLDAVGPSGSVVGLDISPVMIEKAQEKEFPINVCFVEGCAEKIPLPDKSFDVVICFSVFPHFDDKKKALREIRRVLVPGGSLFILHLEGSEKINAFHHGYGGTIKHDHLPDAAGMKHLLENCGFDQIEVTDREDLYLAKSTKPSIMP